MKQENNHSFADIMRGSQLIYAECDVCHIKQPILGMRRFFSGGDELRLPDGHLCMKCDFWFFKTVSKLKQSA